MAEKMTAKWFLVSINGITMNRNPILRLKCPNRQKSDLLGPGTVVSQGWGSLDLGTNFNLLFYHFNQDLYTFYQYI